MDQDGAVRAGQERLFAVDNKYELKVEPNLAN
jgi:hypothetical protein